MLRQRLFTFLIALVSTAGLLPAAVPLVDLVDDRTLAAVSVPDAPALLAGWERTPLATTWADPAFVKFLAPLRQRMEVDAWDDRAKEATGLTVKELLALAEGEVLLALPSFDPGSAQGESGPPVFAALQIGTQQAKLAGMLSESAKKSPGQEEAETYDGVEVTTYLAPKPAGGAAAGKPRFSWALVDGIWLLSSQKERVFAAIDALKRGGVDGSLGKSERFLRTRERASGAAALVYINMPAIYPLMQQGVQKAAAKTEGRPNPMGIDPQAAFAALGLDALGECYLAFRSDAAESRLDCGLVYSEERGILKLLAYEPGPAPRPDWIPAKWTSVSTGRFAFARAYQGLEELVDAISPLLSGIAQGQIRAYNRKLGIDLKRDLVGSLGTDLVSAYSLSSQPGETATVDELDQLIAVTLTNEAAFTRCLEALKSLAGPAAAQMFAKREYLGNTIYSMQPAAAGRSKGVSYAIAGKTFLLGIGSPSILESALQGMASAEGAYWKRDDVKALVARVPQEASSLQVQDLKALVEALIETGVRLQKAENEAGEEKPESRTYVDVDARPDAEAVARHWGMAGGYSTRTSEGLFSTWYIDNPKQ